MPEVIRTFAALVPSVEVQQGMGEVVRASKSLLPELRPVRQENLHLTLRFFGDLEAAARARAMAVMERTAPRVTAFSITLGSIGVFPRWSQPRVLWLGVTEGENRLLALAKTLDRGFQDAGLGSDSRFKAHFTLGRWKQSSKISRAVQEKLRALVQPKAVPVSRMCLMGSVLGREGPTYTVLREFGFSAKSRSFE